MVEDREHWNEQVRRYGAGKAAWSEDVDYTEDNINMIEAAMTLQPRDGLYLDVGCGWGRLTTSFACTRPQATVYGCDVSDNMLDVARQLDRNNGGILDPGEPFFGIRYVRVVGDGSLPFGTNQFDGVWSMLVFQHITNAQVGRYIKEVRRVLKPGGAFIFQYVVGDIYEERDRRRSSDIIMAMATSHFDVVAEMEDPVFPEWRWVFAK